jgi:hypothetical protein
MQPCDPKTNKNHSTLKLYKKDFRVDQSVHVLEENEKKLGILLDTLSRWWENRLQHRCRLHPSSTSDLIICNKCKCTFYCNEKCSKEDAQAHHNFCNYVSYCHSFTPIINTLLPLCDFLSAKGEQENATLCAIVIITDESCESIAQIPNCLSCQDLDQLEGSTQYKEILRHCQMISQKCQNRPIILIAMGTTDFKLLIIIPPIKMLRVPKR